MKEKLQNMLYSFANKSIVKGTSEYDLLYETIQLHPKKDEKIGVGIDYFFVQPSKWNGKQFNFMIKRIDGSQVDFSYINCLKKDKTVKNHWNQIFREIITPQTDAFRQKAFENVGVGDKFVCSHTNLKFSKRNAHVDHIFPLTFDSIYKEFISINNLDLSKIELTKDKGTSETIKIVDAKLREDFYNFHAERCVLRIVCSSANLQAKHTSDYNKQNPSIIKESLLKEYPQYHIL
jgi:hypothetical protein